MMFVGCTAGAALGGTLSSGSLVDIKGSRYWLTACHSVWPIPLAVVATPIPGVVVLKKWSLKSDYALMQGILLGQAAQIDTGPVYKGEAIYVKILGMKVPGVITSASSAGHWTSRSDKHWGKFIFPPIPGWSGSPVFRTSNNKVIGILVLGSLDLSKSGGITPIPFVVEGLR